MLFLWLAYSLQQLFEHQPRRKMFGFFNGLTKSLFFNWFQ